MNIFIHRCCAFIVLSLSLLFAVAVPADAKTVPTATTLTLTSGGAPVTSVAWNSMVTLTAQVKAGREPLTVGQVNFCDAAATYCTDIHMLGMAQLTKAGTAVIRLFPGIGIQSYKAVFAGTPHGEKDYAGSASSAMALSVTGTTYPSATAIVIGGTEGHYSLTATVGGAGATAPAGKVSFRDTTDGNHLLRTKPLGDGTAGLRLLNSSNPATNPYPQFVALADFNGDGKLDLAVPVYSIDTPASDVNIFLGNGDGTFNAAAAFSLTGQNVNNVVVGDFNGDGIPDLALSIVDIGSGLVQVLLGNGDGTFTPMPAIPAEVDIVGATADFNGDGKADLAVLGGGTLTILLGNGDGTFKLTTTPLPGTFPLSLAVGDFNGDGKADLAIGNFGGDTVTVLLGNGDGTFTESASSPQTGVGPAAIVAADFKGDGILDLAVTNSNGGAPDPGSVTLLLGNGDGTFTPAASSPATGSNPYSVSVADLNGDGKVDLVASNSGSNTVTVLLGNGDGTFAAPLTFGAGTNPISAAVGDFNGDGLPDLAAANNVTSSVAVLLTATQSATATATGISPPKGTGPQLLDASYPGDSTYLPSISPTVTVPAATPKFSPAAGTYSLPQSVTITDSTPGAMIYYSTNGMPPLPIFPFQYTGPVTVSASETIQAIAVAAGYPQSAVGSATYNIK
ncbi:MAG: FG-GAP-like repeat-containing protein [Terriglobales bacterium]